MTQFELLENNVTIVGEKLAPFNLLIFVIHDYSARTCRIFNIQMSTGNLLFSKNPIKN